MWCGGMWHGAAVAWCDVAVCHVWHGVMWLCAMRDVVWCGVVWLGGVVWRGVPCVMLCGCVPRVEWLCAPHVYAQCAALPVVSWAARLAMEPKRSETTSLKLWPPAAACSHPHTRTRSHMHSHTHSVRPGAWSQHYLFIYYYYCSQLPYYSLLLISRLITCSIRPGMKRALRSEWPFIIVIRPAPPHAEHVHGVKSRQSLSLWMPQCRTPLSHCPCQGFHAPAQPPVTDECPPSTAVRC